MKRMRRRVRPALRLRAAEGRPFSKLGGAPDLSADVDWPRDGRGGWLDFLAQIDLAEVRAAGGPSWLPDQGLLYLFCEDDEFRDPAHIIHRAERGEGVVDLPPRRNLHPERRISFRPEPCYPSLDWMGVEPGQLDVSPRELDQICALSDEPEGVGPSHWIGGYPSEIQDGAMAAECERHIAGKSEEAIGNVAAYRAAQARAARRWRLLIQIDTDDDLDMTWGDAGRLYVFIPKACAKAGDFSKICSITQCH